jgi:hypothetical protein
LFHLFDFCFAFSIVSLFIQMLLLLFLCTSIPFCWSPMATMVSDEPACLNRTRLGRKTD